MVVVFGEVIIFSFDGSIGLIIFVFGMSLIDLNGVVLIIVIVGDMVGVGIIIVFYIVGEEIFSDIFGFIFDGL